MQFTLDRITDGVAVLEGDDAKMYECDPALLPSEARQGDIFVSMDVPGTPGFAPEPAPHIKEERARRINGLFEKLKNKNTEI